MLRQTGDSHSEGRHQQPGGQDKHDGRRRQDQADRDYEAHPSMCHEFGTL